MERAVLSEKPARDDTLWIQLSKVRNRNVGRKENHRMKAKSLRELLKVFV